VEGDVVQRFILRAEIHTARESIVTYGYDLTADSIFIVTEWRAPTDTRITLRLSVPRALEPIDVACRVSEIRAAGNPGESAGIVFRFDPDASRTDLLTLLETARSLRGNAPELAKYRVLFVEDNGLARDVFAYSARRYFGTENAIEIDHADSAESAWDYIVANEYDLFIVDYFLPKADGATLISRLRADTHRRSTPIVAVSVGGRSARDATLAAGADLFVDKPLVFRDLFNTMRILAHLAKSSDAARRTILVLDDSSLALAVTRAALESAGFNVVIAEDLATFERERERCNPHLILVDVQMPEMFGDDIAATLIGMRAVDVPIVLFSSLDETELARRSAEASATGYISKSAGMTELVRRCRELLGQPT
jgi:DNA-binding response OmpR family regulator